MSTSTWSRACWWEGGSLVGIYIYTTITYTCTCIQQLHIHCTYIYMYMCTYTWLRGYIYMSIWKCTCTCIRILRTCIMCELLWYHTRSRSRNLMLQVRVPYNSSVSLSSPLLYIGKYRHVYGYTQPGSVAMHSLGVLLHLWCVYICLCSCRSLSFLCCMPPAAGRSWETSRTQGECGGERECILHCEWCTVTLYNVTWRSSSTVWFKCVFLSCFLLLFTYTVCVYIYIC